MDTETLIVNCRKCGARNRIPRLRVNDKALCGKCHARLILEMLDKPVAASDATFSTEVMENPTPVLVDFWAPWCGPCRSMGPVLDSLSGKYAGRLKVVKINVDENPVTASRFGIRSIPSLFLFKDGAVATTLHGALPLHELERQIARFIP